jgi:hypothetical protein
MDSTQIPLQRSNWRCELDVPINISADAKIQFLIGPAKRWRADIWYTVEASSEAVGLSDMQTALDRQPAAYAAMHSMRQRPLLLEHSASRTKRKGKAECGEDEAIAKAVIVPCSKAVQEERCAQENVRATDSKISSVRASFGSCSGPQKSNRAVRIGHPWGFPGHAARRPRHGRIGMATGGGTVGEWTTHGAGDADVMQ